MAPGASNDVHAYFFVTLGCWSPINRLAHRFVTLISTVLAPGFSAGDISPERRLPQHAGGLAVHRDRGNVLYAPEIQQHLGAGREPFGRGLDGLRISCRAGEVLHSGIGTIFPPPQFIERDAGRSARLGWNATVQEPSIVPTAVSVTCGSVRPCADPALRKTMNTASARSSFKETVVRPLATL